jgi:hypothetical protein
MPLPSWGPDDWQAYIAARAEAWERATTCPRAEAERLAWNAALTRWHLLHGRRAPSWQCAGCGKAISGGEALALPDGTRVHISTFDCLTMYGHRWRGEATAALLAMGLTPPAA